MTNKISYNINIKDHDRIFVNDFTVKKLDVIDRIDFIKKVSNGKRVLHFGFLDAPFLKKKIMSGQLLHQMIKQKCSFIYGIDIDKISLKHYRKITRDYNNKAINISEKVLSSKTISSLANNYEILLFTEILEHVDNAGIALKNIKMIMDKNPSSKLIITVPNAFSYGGNEYARAGYEIVHPEHYYYFSPVTLRRLLKDFGFRSIALKLLENGGTEGVVVEGISSSSILAIASA